MRPEIDSHTRPTSDLQIPTDLFARPSAECPVVENTLLLDDQLSDNLEWGWERFSNKSKKSKNRR
jgi:hypothetical protein